jgi:hypothetical protein
MAHASSTMQQRCEVCENFRPEGDLVPGRKLEEVTFGARKVLLCRAHAGIATNSGVTTFEELRELYTEQRGIRSYVPRRSPSLTRPPGRRQSDARS